MEELLLENDFGFCLAYHISDINNFDYNFGITDSNVISEVLLILKKNNIKNFIFIEELFIDDEFRKQGYGKELFINFLEQFDATSIPFLLFAGSIETPKNLDIVSFYEFFGFETLIEIDYSPLMIKNYF